jgi:hypothetical protein
MCRLPKKCFAVGQARLRHLRLERQRRRCVLGAGLAPGGRGLAGCDGPDALPAIRAAATAGRKTPACKRASAQSHSAARCGLGRPRCRGRVPQLGAPCSRHPTAASILIPTPTPSRPLHALLNSLTPRLKKRAAAPREGAGSKGGRRCQAPTLGTHAPRRAPFWQRPRRVRKRPAPPRPTPGRPSSNRTGHRPPAPAPLQPGWGQGGGRPPPGAAVMSLACLARAAEARPQGGPTLPRAGHPHAPPALNPARAQEGPGGGACGNSFPFP